jgi:hypothetical protein
MIVTKVFSYFTYFPERKVESACWQTGSAFQPEQEAGSVGHGA